MNKRFAQFALAVGLGLAFVTGGAHARDADLAQAQLHLKILGYEPGPVDGSIGGRTLAALEKFHADRGGNFDGAFGIDDVDALYDALAAVPFNGASPAIDAETGRTTQNRQFDFVPEVDLATLYTPLTTLKPEAFGTMLRAAENTAFCASTTEAFPAAGQPLRTYSSFREFETTGRRNLHPGVKWLEELSFAVQIRAGAALLGDTGAADELKAALLEHAEAGSALHSASLVDRDGRLIVYPDFAAGTIATQALIANYLIAREALSLSDDEQSRIETWLSRLFETFPDSAFALNIGGASISQEVGRLGRSMMLHALMTNDVDQFNEGAQLALSAASFVREDGSERLGASRGNRALFYQGTALMYAMETYVILASQGVDAATIMGPTVHRLADFWGRAWHDHSVLFPYARENESVFVGSDYRQQDQVQVSAGIDLYLAIAEDGESRDRLLEARATYPFRRMIGDVFVSTCIAQTLGDYEPPATMEGGGVGGIESDSALEVAMAIFFQIDEEQFYTGYGVNLAGVTLDGAPYNIDRFEMIADWVGRKDRIANLELLRISFDRSELSEAESRAAEYTTCGPVAAVDDQWGQRFRLHFGTEAQSNACILDKMGARDRLFWSTILVNFDVVLDAASGDALAEDIRAMYEHKM